MALKESLKIENLREQLDGENFTGMTFVLAAGQKAPFTLVGLVAKGWNYLPAPIPVQPGQLWVSVPLNPPPPPNSEIWWAVLAGTGIAGMAAVLVAGASKRLLGRKASVARAEVWSGNSVV